MLTGQCDVPFYHFTRESDVEQVLAEGLRPRTDTGNDRAYSHLGDPDFVYLWSSTAADRVAADVVDGKGPWPVEETAVLAVDLPDTHPVERDYDMVLYPLHTTDSLDALQDYLDDLGNQPFDGPATEDAVLSYADAIPEDHWIEFPGSYRTPETVPAEYLTQLDLPPTDR